MTANQNVWIRIILLACALWATACLTVIATAEYHLAVYQPASEE